MIYKIIIVCLQIAHIRVSHSSDLASSSRSMLSLRRTETWNNCPCSSVWWDTERQQTMSASSEPSLIGCQRHLSKASWLTFKRVSSSNSKNNPFIYLVVHVCLCKYFTFQTNILYMFKPLHQRRHSSSLTSTGSGSDAPCSLCPPGWFTGGPPGTTMASKGNYATLYTIVNVICWS